MRRTNRSWATVLVVVMGLVAGATVTATLAATPAIAAVAPAGTATTFPLAPAAPGGIPLQAVAGADGALWVAADHSVHRVTTTGVVTSWEDPAFNVHAVAAGADGALWFADAGAIHRITTAGVRTTFVTQGAQLPRGGPGRITAGPDGALWFTIVDTPALGRITTAGVITTLPLPDGLVATDLTTGPDGALWFLAREGLTSVVHIGAMTTAGIVRVFDGSTLTDPQALTAGPDGALWFTDFRQGTVERITVAGVRTTYPLGLPGPTAMAVGPDGALWIALFDAGATARVTTGGQLLTFALPDVEATDTVTAGPDGAVWLGGYGGDAFTLTRVQAVGPPSAPSHVTAIAGAASATIAWDAPADGGSGITGYTVTASPGGASCTWVAGPRSCSISGLTVGVSYQFAVTATNASGTGPPASSSAVVPRAGGRYHPVAPARVLDSRTAVGGWPGPLGADGRDLALDPATVPSSATAVILNVTVTAPSTNSYLTVWPSGEARPTASNLNYAPSQTIANQVTVRIGAGHAVQFATAAGTTHLVADVVGWFDDGTGAGSSYNPMTPTRILDSRSSAGGWANQLTAGAPRDLALNGVPTDATAVIANITATGSTAGSYLTVWPAGQPRPTASNLNFAAGETIPNLAVVPIGADRKISFATNTGSTDVVVDVAGWFSPSTGSRFHPLSPLRVLDDRLGVGLSGPWGPNESRTLTVQPPVPDDATGLVANVTATNPTAPSFVRVHPAGQALPNVSNLNFARGQTIPNLVMTPIGTNHGVTFHNTSGSVDLVADVVGFYAPT